MLNGDLERHRKQGKLNDSWAHRSCKTIRSDAKANLRPPPEAVQAVKELIIKHVGQPAVCTSKPVTTIEAPLLEASRAAAKEPDTEVSKWLMDGAA